MTTYTIYGLAGPDRNIRYVGASSRDEKYVLSHHRSSARASVKAGKRTPMTEWMTEVGKNATYKVIRSGVKAEDKDAVLKEIIDNMRASGVKLLNMTKEQHAERVREGMNKPEVKAMLKNSRKGRVNTPEHRKAISEANKGRVISEEHKAIISVIHSGKILSEETKKKISEKAKGHKRNLGKHHSEEAKLRMSHTRHQINHVGKGLVKDNCRWCGGEIFQGS